MAEQSASYRDGRALVSTDWLEAHLDDPQLRIFDCTTQLLPPEPGTDAPYRVVPSKAEYDQGHIPGAGFLDLQGEVSDNSSGLALTLPPAEQFAAVMSDRGVSDGTRVVLYSAGNIMWATRMWWMLRVFGFDDAAVLDGGWDKWQAEGRPVSTAAPGHPPATFVARPRPELVVDKQQVLSAIGAPDHVTVNALPAELHGGKKSPYGRPGHIPGSVNVPYPSLLDPETNTLVAPADAQQAFADAGVRPDKNVICYCGGGVSATIELFLLHQLGYDNLALYDGSLGEWAKDESLPIETG